MAIQQKQDNSVIIHSQKKTVHLTLKINFSFYNQIIRPELILPYCLIPGRKNIRWIKPNSLMNKIKEKVAVAPSHHTYETEDYAQIYKLTQEYINSRRRFLIAFQDLSESPTGLQNTQTSSYGWHFDTWIHPYNTPVDNRIGWNASYVFFGMRVLRVI